MVKEYKIHKCNFQGEGARVEFTESHFQEGYSWQLVISRKATEADLEKNHYLDDVGDIIWSTVIEINNCPFCGETLRLNPADIIQFIHLDSSGWLTERQ